MENETEKNSAIEETSEKENIEEVNDTEKLDEDLITAVKDRPALYDFRMPVKERGRKQKDCLWQEVSKCLNGSIYIYLLICLSICKVSTYENTITCINVS